MKNPARLVLAALPLLCISLFAPSGAFAQGMNFRLEPADGVIPSPKRAARNACIATARNTRAATARWCASRRALTAFPPARPKSRW